MEYYDALDPLPARNRAPQVHGMAQVNLLGDTGPPGREARQAESENQNLIGLFVRGRINEKTGIHCVRSGAGHLHQGYWDVIAVVLAS
jgi:hypothetical protein